MAKSTELYNTISGLGKSDFYKYGNNEVFVNGELVCKIYSSFAFFKFDAQKKDVLNELDCFVEGFAIPVYPVPPALFMYDIAKLDAGIAGECWASYFKLLQDDAIENGSQLALKQLNRLIDGYLHFYTTHLEFVVPKISQEFLKSIDVAEIEKACLDKRLDIHREQFKPFLKSWKDFTGADVLKNKTGFDYIRFNKSEKRFESTLGLHISISDMIIGIEMYEQGKKEFMLSATSFSPNEDGIEEYMRHELPVVVLDNGDVKINCVVILKDEFLNININGEHYVI